MLSSSAGPSDVAMVERRFAHSGSGAPSYGLSVTSPSVMLMTIGGNESGFLLTQS